MLKQALFSSYQVVKIKCIECLIIDSRRLGNNNVFTDILTPARKVDVQIKRVY